MGPGSPSWRADAFKRQTTCAGVGRRPSTPLAITSAAVGVREDRGALRTLVRRHRWTFPVAQDRDGAVANVYGVAICPTLVFARRGGRVRGTALGEQSAAALARRVRPLVPTAARG